MIVTIICAVIIFSVIIFVHELGHFIAAKAFGVNVLEFAIGMGPAIFKKQGKNTLYSIRAIPMGGFCKMEGEDEDTQTEGCFSSKKPIPKIVVLAAGAGMNVLLGFIIVTSVVFASAFQTGMMPSTVVESVNPEASAAEFLQKGDRIVKINDAVIHIQKDISFELSNTNGDECTIEYIRDGSVCRVYTTTYTNPVAQGYYTCPGGYYLSGDRCYGSESYNEEVTKYKEVTYYRYQKREKLDQKIETIWGIKDNQELLNQGYTMGKVITCEF